MGRMSGAGADPIMKKALEALVASLGGDRERGLALAKEAAAAEDASAIYFNPAGLTRIPRGQVVGVLNLVKLSSKFSNDGSCTP